MLNILEMKNVFTIIFTFLQARLASRPYDQSLAWYDMLAAMVTNESHHRKHHTVQTSTTSVAKQVAPEKVAAPRAVSAPEVAYVPAQFHHQKEMSIEEKVFKV